MPPKKTIRTTKEEIELQVIHPVYRKKVVYEPYPEGDLIPVEKQQLVKELRVKKWFKKEAITSVEQYVTARHTIAKERSLVFDKYSGRFYATNHTPDDVIARIHERYNHQEIGFHGNNLQTGKTRIYKP